MEAARATDAVPRTVQRALSFDVGTASRPLGAPRLRGRYFINVPENARMSHSPRLLSQNSPTAM
jgi:hypothetical protein